ncbi:MAG: hypothetical protein ACP5PJ_05600 [Acidimicrobiales bacterium]
MNRLTRGLRSFGTFLWDFIVGDDVRIAIGVVVGLVAVELLHQANVSGWWALPIFWVLALSWSLVRATRKA